VGDRSKQPHAKDELYLIVSGKAARLIGEDNAPVEAGSLVHAPAQVVHRVHTITEALSILVFVAPADYIFRASPVPQP
jgi:mannose-6-phosphate isomerase-like protein (cupin superfamily)